MKPVKIIPVWVVLLYVAIWAFGCEGDQGTQGARTSEDSDDKPHSTDPNDSDYEWNETDTCANLDLFLERQPTTIMLVIDHSASMDLQMGDNDTRWSVMVSVLMGTTASPESGLVWSLESQVNFGMVLFTAKRNQPETCPMLQTVSPALNNGGTIASIFKADDETYKGASPVPEGIRAATQLLTEMGGLGKKVILLATDGAPQTCDTLAVVDDPFGREESISAVQDAYSSGISTFVVGLGDETTFDHLQQVANAGVGLTPDGSEDAMFHQGLTENSLVDAITQIITTESRSCVYELDGKGITEGEESQGTVSIDGEALELNNSDYGWRLKSTSEIELLGGACDMIQVGGHHIEADFPCEVIVNIVAE
ncbi:MAG: VWA domain-containing protein [Deltaproteobacteria bacterium]|nr:VWA domain-containing protein [Deltaproteobacteria bacterium]MBN2673650.1 VWA domain-containing protein [Deltaproteobacteria bacterium]